MNWERRGRGARKGAGQGPCQGTSVSGISQALTAVLLGGLKTPLLNWLCCCCRPTPVSVRGAGWEGPVGACARLTPYDVSRQVFATSLRVGFSCTATYLVGEPVGSAAVARSGIG